MTKIIAHIPIQNISVNPYQPRRSFNEEELEELASSIKAIGIIQPPLVRPIDNMDGHFELIAGERRLRASEKAGLTHICVIIQHTSDAESAEIALIENIQRVDLDPIDTALAIQSLLARSGWTQERVANKVGKKRSTVANYLRLLALPISIKEALSKGIISTGHAKVILSLDVMHHQLLLHEKIVKNGLTVRESEVLAAKLSQKTQTPQPKLLTRNFHLEELQDTLQTRLGTKVTIEERGKKGGRISIDYYNLDDLDRLLHILQ